MRSNRRAFLAAATAVGASAAPSLGAGQLEQKAVGVPTSRAKALMTLFGLKYPIFEAPHGPNVTSPELAIAVSNAGAMGAIALTGVPPDKARAVVSKIRAATRGSFFANYILAVMSEKEPSSLMAVLDAGAPIVQFSWGLPTKESISAIRSAGARLGIQVGSADSARAALDLGADYLVCQGTEAGGHVQGTSGLYEALPSVLKEAKEKPVIASGGIGNGQGIRKALLSGASGAMLGTRFVATIESYAHPAYKKAVIAARARDTALTICFQEGWPAMHRALRNRTFVMWESAGCPSPGRRPGEGDVVVTSPTGRKYPRYWAEPPGRELQGEVAECALYAGLSVEFVKDLPAAGELVHRLWRECERAE